MPNPTSPAVFNPVLDREPADCFQEVLPEAKALRPDEIVAYNVDADSAAGIAIGNYPEIEALLPDILAFSPTFDVNHVKKLPVRAKALTYINDVCVLARTPDDGLPALAEEGEQLRSRLRSDLGTLAKRGFVNPQDVEKITGLRGYKLLAADLRIITMLIRDNWAVIEGKCAIDRAEVDRAAQLASIITRLQVLREESPAVVAQSADLRARVFTLLDRSYDEVRRMVRAVRWHEGDYDEIAPSLRSNRKSGSSKRKDNESAEPSAPAPAAPAPTTAPAPTEDLSAAPKPYCGGRDGTPDADPFID